MFKFIHKLYNFIFCRYDDNTENSIILPPVSEIQIIVILMWASSEYADIRYTKAIDSLLLVSGDDQDSIISYINEELFQYYGIGERKYTKGGLAKMVVNVINNYVRLRKDESL